MRSLLIRNCSYGKGLGNAYYRFTDVLHTIFVYNKKAAIAYNDTDKNRSFDFDQKISYIRISTA